MSCTNAAVSDASELPVSSDALTPVAQRQAMELRIKQLKAGAGLLTCMCITGKSYKTTGMKWRTEFLTKA